MRFPERSCITSRCCTLRVSQDPGAVVLRYINEFMVIVRDLKSRDSISRHLHASGLRRVLDLISAVKRIISNRE